MLQLPTQQELPWIVRAIQTGTAGEEGLTHLQRVALEGVAHDLMQVDIDFADLEPLPAVELKKHVHDPQMLEQVVEIMVGLTLLDPQHTATGEVDEEQRISVETSQRIESYAGELGISPPGLKNMHDLAKHRMLLATIDQMRYTPVGELERAQERDEGLIRVLRGFAATKGHGSDAAAAAKFHQLEDLPDGSWGKQVSTMYRNRGWAYPGDVHGAPEAVSVDDWVHVLSGYPPTPVGELQVWSFIMATSMSKVGLGSVVIPLTLYGVGGVTPPYEAQTKGANYERNDIGELFAEAVQRSLACGTDLLEGVDHWGMAAQPVEQLRDQFHIPEKSLDIGDPDPGLEELQPVV